MSDEEDEFLYDIPIASIDAGSQDVELIICLQLTPNTLARTYPVPDIAMPSDSKRVEDWQSELSNQLIGRLKSKLIAHNCTLSLGLPITYYNTGKDDLFPENSSKMSLFFNLDEETCACFISIETFSEIVTFSFDKIEDADISEPGAIDLF